MIVEEGTEKRERGTPRENTLLERVPPYDEGAEIGILGAMLIEMRAAKIAIEEVKPDDFYIPRHRTLFKTFSELFTKHGTLDELFVVGELARRMQLEAIGGKETIAKILMATPSAAGIETYCHAVKETSAARRIIESAGRAIQAAQNCQIEEAHLALSKIPPYPTAIIEPQTFVRPSALLKYDTENDPNNMIGNRWLCRGYTLLMAGQTGIGKSSIAMQAAVTWAFGEDLFGIRPIRPMRSLILQGENDMGDNSEMLKGVINGLDLGARTAEIESRIMLVSECEKTGDDFIKFAREVILFSKPDIVFIDPLFNFFGGDVSKQEACSHFLRNGLNPIAQETGCIFIIVHHTNKPSQNPNNNGAYKGGDFAYLGSGSAELANCCRAVAALIEKDSGIFEFRLPKRGRRAGMTINDEPTAQCDTVIYLKHGDHGICWQRAPTPISKKDQAINEMVDLCIANLEPNRKYYDLDLRDFVVKFTKCSSRAVYNPTTHAYHILSVLKQKTVNPSDANTYIRIP